MKDSPDDNEDYADETTYSFEFGSDLLIPKLNDNTKNPTSSNTASAGLKKNISQDIGERNGPSNSSLPSIVSPGKVKPRSRPRSNVHTVDKDIAAYKRVIWQYSDE